VIEVNRYKFTLDPNPAADDDLIFTYDGMSDSKVIIDSVSLGLISGSTIDYVEEMMSSSFRVKDNPNSKQSCGCGSSFEPKKV
jgi:iron-sulfur cluster insertion protein